MKTESLNRLGFRFTEEDINIISLVKERPHVTDRLTESEMEKVRILKDIIQEYYSSIDISKKIYINSTNDVLAAIYPTLKALDHMECWIMLLNSRNRLIKKEMLACGSDREYIVDTKAVIRRCIETRASAFILVTNRTEDDVEPTCHDITVTEKLLKAAKALDLYMLDHVIISENACHSITERHTKRLTEKLLKKIRKQE